MVYSPATISNTMSTYLHQWVTVASGGRVSLSQQGAFGSKSFLVFKCTCGDNWHVGTENFSSPTGVPEVLSDWVKKHRHVCTKYTNTHGISMGTCSMCGWPYGAHEDSWIGGEGKPIPAPRGHPAYKEKPLPTFKGRKFRDADTETVSDT